MVAICAESVEKNLAVSRQQQLFFPILSDLDLAATDSYGLRHKKGNPIEGSDISRPAIFLLDAEGIVRWRYLTDNWRVRVRPEEVVQRLSELP